MQWWSALGRRAVWRLLCLACCLAAPSPRACLVVEPCTQDEDGDGFCADEGDCDDRNPGVHPGAEETCNREDTDCDGVIDNVGPLTGLSPGVYGAEDAHAVITGTVQDVSIGDGIYSGGDFLGGGVEGLVLSSVAGLLVFPAGFCEGEMTTESASFRVVASGGRLRSGHFGDLNGDGIADLRSDGVIYLSPHSSVRELGDLELAWGAATALRAGDLNGDGVIDLVAGHYGLGAVGFWDGSRAQFALEPDAVVESGFGGGFFAETIAMSAGEAPQTLIGRGAEVAYVTGLPQDGASGGLDGSIGGATLFPDGSIGIGYGLESNGRGRFCVGTDPSGVVAGVVCGTTEELASGLPDFSYIASGRGGVGPWIAMSEDLVAVGDPSATVGANALSGRVLVEGPWGSWSIEWREGNGSAFGRGVALLNDPAQGVYWLAIGAPTAGEHGKVLLYPLERQPR